MDALTLVPTTQTNKQRVATLMSPWAVHHSAAIGGGEMIIQIFSGIGIGISIEMIAVVQLLISLFPG